MDVPGWDWLRTIVRLVALLVFDFPSQNRTTNIPTVSEAATW